MTRHRVVYIHSDNLIDAADRLPANIGRASLVHELIAGLDLLSANANDSDPDTAPIIAPIPATREDLLSFHEARYVDAILGDNAHASDSDSQSGSDSSSSSDSIDLASFHLAQNSDARPAKRARRDSLGLADDCPLFDELPEYARLVAGASITAARELRDGRADVAISWTGGRHHGKRGQAAGFCYVQDIALAILELRRPPIHDRDSLTEPQPPRIRRVLYLDIDIHHGDGVEASFYTSPYTLTLSMHHHDVSFFPTTGALSSTGPAKGPAACHALNVALRDGLSSQSLLRLFDSCVQPIYDIFKPDAVVLQCGCDGLAGDPVKKWNLDLTGMGEVVRRVVHDWGKITLLLGGGGYDNANAARCWAYLTSVALGRPLSLDTPIPSSFESEQYRLFAPSFTLDVPAGHQRDQNIETKLVEVETAFKTYHEQLRIKYTA